MWQNQCLIETIFWYFFKFLDFLKTFDNFFNFYFFYGVLNFFWIFLDFSIKIFVFFFVWFHKNTFFFCIFCIFFSKLQRLLLEVTKARSRQRSGPYLLVSLKVGGVAVWGGKEWGSRGHCFLDLAGRVLCALKVFSLIIKA